MKTNPVHLLTVTLVLSSSALAANISLENSLSSALSAGKEVSDARANLISAQADLAAKQADPTSLIGTLQSAQNTLALSTLKLSSTQLSTLQTVMTNYTSLFEGQRTVEQNAAQVNLDSRNLSVTQAKRAAQNATDLDVSSAQNTLSTSQQTLSNNTAQLAVLSAKLALTIGQGNAPDLKATPYPAMPALSAQLAELEKDVLTKSPEVLQAQQAVSSAQLTVKLSDNDYTPRRTLEDAKTSLDTANRTLENSQKSVLTSLRDAYRTAQDAQKQVALAQTAYENQTKSYAQDQVRLTSGLISNQQLLVAEVTLKNSLLSLDRAKGSYARALSALSVAAGRDVTGLLAAAVK